MMKALFSLFGVITFCSLNADPVQPSDQTSKSNLKFDRGDQTLSPNTPSAYNFPASVKLKDSWHLFTTASYICWFAGEGGLDLATTAAYLSGTNTVIPSNREAKTIFQDFEYGSGFKVGLGGSLCCDNWILRADYTRMHQLTEKSKSAPESEIGVGALWLTDWFFQVSPQQQGIAASDLCSKWHLELDWLDLSLERPLYSGRKLTLTPFMGLRTSWIEQSVHINVRNALNVSPPTATLHSRNHLESWGIGPRAGIDAHFLLGLGFRIQGEVGGSLLYTQFSKVCHSEDPFTADSTEVAFAMHDFNCVRPMMEANLGLGWGTYLAKQRYHLDFSATYDFNYLWSQNMLRVLNDLQIIGTNAAANDLYLHGATLTACFNF
jgi:hypothetical protein